MKSRRLLWSALGAVALFIAIGGGWIFSLPPAPSIAAAPPIAPEEADATIAALEAAETAATADRDHRHQRRHRDHRLSDALWHPRRADVADVVTLATEPGPVTLFPALKVEPQATVAEFDAQHPDGADYVIVPAMSRDDDPAALQWIRSQAAKGAIIIGVCAGAKVVGNAGLLRRQAGDDPLVFPQGAARQASRDPLCRRPAAGGRPRRCDDDGNHRVDADVAHADRGHRRPRQGARPSAATSASPTGTRVTTATRSSSRARLR